MHTHTDAYNHTYFTLAESALCFFDALLLLCSAFAHSLVVSRSLAQVSGVVVFVFIIIAVTFTRKPPLRLHNTIQQFSMNADM
jgi:hypothetical protein